MNLLVIVLSSQLLYYLLIAQTGVVGVFDSEIKDFFTLPIGGVIGSLLSAYWRHREIKIELAFLFGAQLILSWIYPDYSLGVLLLLGFVIGYTAPLLLYIFGSQSKTQLVFGLAISYAVGTALYDYPFTQRGGIAIALPLISLIALYFVHVPERVDSETKRVNGWIIGVLMLWIFADSALFETLSRSEGMDIWSHYTLLIIASHLAGVVLGYVERGTSAVQIYRVWGLFMASYSLYWLKEPILLAIVYPLVISYYNVLLFHYLIRLRDIRAIAISMIGVGWMAAAVANGVALYHQQWVVIAVLTLFAVLYPFYFRRVL